ncbi:hypothetical protein BGZ94_001314 [Podila epigama]|nr:hypothetical protein BGZ94_001314 [Podila epigama]
MDPRDVCDNRPDGEAVPLGMTRRVILLSLGSILSLVSFVSTYLFQRISKRDNNLRQRGRYLVTLQGYFATFFLFIICHYQAIKCRIPCFVLFWGAYLGLVPFVLVYTGRVWRLISRFDRNNAIYQSRFADPVDLAAIDLQQHDPNHIPVMPQSTNENPHPHHDQQSSILNLSTLDSTSNSMEHDKIPEVIHPNKEGHNIVPKKWYNRYRSVTDKQMLALAIIFLLISEAIGAAFQFTTPGISMFPPEYNCHSGSEYYFPYVTAIFFLFVLSPIMVYQLKGINDGFGIRNELIFLSIFSFPCFVLYFLVPALAPKFSREIMDRTTFMAFILIASQCSSILAPLARHFKASHYECAYTARLRRGKPGSVSNTGTDHASSVTEQASTATDDTTFNESLTDRVREQSLASTGHSHLSADAQQHKDQAMAMDELGPDHHARKGSVTKINMTLRNLIRNQRGQRFQYGGSSQQDLEINSKQSDWDEFLRVLEDKRLFERLSAFTVREFCAENTRFLYEVSRLERRAVQYERLRNLSLSPSEAVTLEASRRTDSFHPPAGPITPRTAQLSKSPSTASTTHSTIMPLPSQFSNAETPHRIKKIVSASSMSSNVPMLRTRRSSLSYVDDSEPSSPMASSSNSVFMRYGSTPALPDQEEGAAAYKSGVQSKSEGRLEIVEVPTQEFAPLPMPPTLLIQYEYMYRTFVSRGGRLELNLSHDTAQELHRKARRAEWHSGMFDGAVFEIQELLFRDVWPKFVTSSQGLHYNGTTADSMVNQLIAPSHVSSEAATAKVAAGTASDTRTSVFVPFEQQLQLQPSPSKRTTPSPSIHMSPKSSLSGATSARMAMSLNGDSGSIENAGSSGSRSGSRSRPGSGKARMEDDFEEEPSRTGFRAWLSKKNRTGITASALISREGCDEESLGIIEQSRKSTADRRSDTSGL